MKLLMLVCAFVSFEFHFRVIVQMFVLKKKKKKKKKIKKIKNKER
jgi:NADH:ubiquinone oxidoreductase subunit 2 (subunit N)